MSNRCRKIAGVLVTFIVVTTSGCSTVSDPATPVTQEEPINWTNRACQSPVYQQMIGVFRGELRLAQNGRLCVWDSTVMVAGVSAGLTCDLEGTIESTLVEQGPQTEAPFICDSGIREVTFANDLGANDDLNTTAPQSLGFNFLPDLPQRDPAGNEILHAVTQFEFVVVNSDGLLSETTGLLTKQ